MHCYIKVEKRSGIKHFISTQHVALLYILLSHNSQMGWYFLSWLIIRCHIENFFSWRLARLCLNGNSYFCQQTKNCAIYFLSSYAGWNHKFEELLCILITIFVNWASCLLHVFSAFRQLDFQSSYFEGSARLRKLKNLGNLMLDLSKSLWMI